MVPVQKSANPEAARRSSSEIVISQKSATPIVVIQRRNSIPTEESKQVDYVSTFPGQKQSSPVGRTDMPAPQTQYILSVAETNTSSAAAIKGVETDIEMTGTNVDDAESFEQENSSQEPKEIRNSVITRLRKRRLGSSPIGSDGELPETSVASTKRDCIENQDEEGNVVVEKLAPVFSTQPFAISESRGSSPRIPNSPRISEVAVQSDSSTESDVATPDAATEVTIVETQVTDLVSVQPTELVQSECIVESQVCAMYQTNIFVVQ